MNPIAVRSIKVISSLVMSIALGSVGWDLYLHAQGESLPANLTFLVWFGSVALVAHGMEGLIAASKASSQHKNPLIYGIYTFFVGFVGLQELSNNDN
ncbi:MAG: hypothetical protein AAGK10_08305 [Cyanobacteria bacterium J06555_3]